MINKKINFKKIFIIIVVIIIVILFFGSIKTLIDVSSNFVSKQWQEYKLNKDFICPENQNEKDAESYLYKYAKFYKDNYPNMTLSEFLGRRMELLVSHKCTVTLQNLADNNNDGIPNENSVKELKEMPRGQDNPILKDLYNSIN